MKLILTYLKPYVPRMSLGLSIKFIGSIMDLLLPWVLSYLIDQVVPTQEVPLIFLWGGVMVLASVAAVVTNILANRMASRVAQLTTRAIRHDLFSKISYLSCAQIDRFTIPSLEARLTTDTYHIHQMIGMMQRMGVRAPILLIGGVLITLSLDPLLTLVLVCSLPFMGYAVYRISKKGVPLYGKLQQAADTLVRTVRENITGMRVIKALSKVDYERERFHRVNTDVVEKETKAGVTMALSNPLMNLFLNAGLVGVIVVGAFLVNAGMTQPGKIIAFLSYFTIILNAMLSVTRIFVMYSKGSASANRIALVLEAPEDFTVTPQPLVPEDAPYHIVFDQVSFSYKKKEPSVEEISFRIKPRESLGILGGTGSGKTTLAALLLRLYDCDKGRISLSGHPISSIPLEQLHTKFGMVFQGDFLLADTVYENIDFGRGLPKEAIEKAARCAQAMEFISQLPQGFSHLLTAKGTNLSGGQKQRLLIARALAASPEILILDDSSSALDYQTDALLRLALREEYPQVTTVLIAQRISSIFHCNHILVLEEGKEIGYGNHEELMDSCPIYREIADSQLGRRGEV